MDQATQSTEHPVGSLERALDYRADHIVHKFLERFDIPFEEAADLFEETKKWLWLATVEDHPVMMITNDLILLDEMWHTFVLFTREYAEFCTKHLGRFVHHQPTTQAEIDQNHRDYAEDPESFSASWNEKLRLELEFIADQLGQDTVFKWFVEYPRRYGASFFERAAKPIALNALSPQFLDQLENIAARYEPDDSRDAPD